MAQAQSETHVLWTIARLVLGTGTAGLLAVAALAQLRDRKAKAKKHRILRSLQPSLQFQQNGSVSGIEPFGQYAARQIGLQDKDVCYDAFKKVAEHYVRGDKSQGDTSRDELMALVMDTCSRLNESAVGDLSHDLVKELDACILSFFGFHWDHADKLLAAASATEPKRHSLKRAVLSATRVQRYQQLLRSLGPQRQFATLVQQLKGLHTGDATDVNQVSDKEVAAPVEEGKRSPVILFMAGGMGAGKSTVRQELMHGTFWRKFAPRAVVVEADAFKEHDVVFQALSEQEGGVASETAALVHSSSVKAALSLLVAALNEGRDIIFDGTMSWAPFVVQTIEMVRDAHLHRYRMGPGYEKKPDGSIIEQYWEIMPADIIEETRAQQQSHVREYDDAQAERMTQASVSEDSRPKESGNEAPSMKESKSSQSLGGFSEQGARNSFKNADGPSKAHAAEDEKDGKDANGNDGRTPEPVEAEGSEGQSKKSASNGLPEGGEESSEGPPQSDGDDLARRPSGHWAHVDGSTVKSNMPSQGPSGFAARPGTKVGWKSETDLEHTDGQQNSAKNDLGHRPGLVATGPNGEVEKRRPYRVEMVGVACDAGLSVVRGMRRAILTGRGVPVEAQLRSHRMFAAAFEDYAVLMDRASLYVTNGFGSAPELVALKEGLKNRLLVDPPSIKGFRQLRHLNEKAASVAALYKEDWGSGTGGSRHDTGAFGGAWVHAVMGEERKERQRRLQTALRGMESRS